MRAFFSAAEIAAAQGVHQRAVNKTAQAAGWRTMEGKARKQTGRDGGGGWEYHVSLLPVAVQARLKVIHDAPANANTDVASDNRSALWARYEALSSYRKAACEGRLKAVSEVAGQIAAGLTKTAAVTLVAADRNVSPRALRIWLSKVDGVDRADWLPALADNYRATAQSNECHPDAWAALKSDFLRPEAPKFSACYRRMAEAAPDHGWSPIPSEQSLRRRLNAEVPKAVQTAARETREVLKTLYPAQRRSVAALHAMQAVNADGHRLDLFVRVPGKTDPVRVYLVALQDLYSRKVLAWRLALSENKDAVRLAIGDMVERYGIPDEIFLDNGRAFASKWITGGSVTRYRFKVREEEPQGVLTALGVNIHWTTPYHGQAKPIERAFLDLAEEIAKHPKCSGAYTGNRPDAKPENYASKAVDFDVLRVLVAQQVARHNARTGRRTEMAGGRSFDETFSASIADENTIVRWPTDAQRSLWLLAAERIRTQKGSGVIHLFGNRYWHQALNGFAGRRLTVRFDPDNLTRPVHVYDNADRLVCVADCIADTGFVDTDAARQHAAKKNALTRNLKESARLHAELSPNDLAELYGAGVPTPEPAPEPPRVKRVVGGAPVSEPGWTDEDEDAVERALQRIEGQVIEFPKGDGGR
jgi:transposase InsO family protein